MMLALAMQVMVLGAVGVLEPVLTRRTTPLGVSIPSGYIHHPVVTSAVRTYQLLAAGVAGLVLVVLLVLPADAVSLAFAVAPLTVVCGGAAAFVWQRRRIIAVKNQENWYQGRPVGISAALTDDGDRDLGDRQPFVVWPLVGGVVSLLSTVLYGVARHDLIPDPYPASIDALGEPTRWVPKAPFDVFFGPGLCLIVAVAVVALVWWLPRRPQRGFPDGDVRAATTRRALHHHATREILAWITLAQGVGVSALSILTWHGQWGPPFAAALGVMLTAVMVAVLIPVLRILPALRAVDASIRPGQDRETPDDDRFWILGIIYVNRKDPAVMVPYRTGLGMTINMGHPIGMAFMAAMMALLIWSIAQGG